MLMGGVMSDWLITRILSNSYSGMRRELERRAVEHFYPQCRIRCLTNGRYATEVTPILPNYMFIHSPTYWYHLLDLPGLISIVKSSFTDLPYRSHALDREVVDLLETRDADGLCPVPDAMKARRLSKFMKGDVVRIVTGVCDGVSGTVEDVSHTKVTVSAGDFRVRVAEGDVIMLSPGEAVQLHLTKGKRRRVHHLQEKMNAT